MRVEFAAQKIADLTLSIPAKFVGRDFRFIGQEQLGSCQFRRRNQTFLVAVGVAGTCQ
jgi:hypothetical protein